MATTSSSSSERGTRGVNRVLVKLHNSIESGNFYEAHQMYRTLYFRYQGQQKFEECLDLLYDGALKLLVNQQETSGADLGILLLDTLEKRSNCTNKGTMSTDDIDLWMLRIGTIIARLGANIVERDSLITRSVKWSGDVSGNSLGHPKMHKLIAETLYAESNVEQARLHYILCRDGATCGRFLIDISESKGFFREVDLFIVQAVLQQLCLKDLNTAENTFNTFTSNHPQIQRKEPPFKLPLLNFLSFLFRTIDTGRLDMYTSLCDLYKSSLQRDPSYERYLLKIGVVFFGATQPSRQQSGGMMGGIFGEIFSRIMNGFEDEEDDDSEHQRRIRNLSNRGSVSGGGESNELD